MISQTVVRAPVAADARAMARIWFDGELASLRESYPGRDPAEWFTLPSVDWCERYWRSTLAVPSSGAVTLVAERDRRVLGFATAGKVDDDEPGWGQIHSLYVHPRAWATGIGTTLLARCESWLALEGFTTALLWAVRGNWRSRSFYEQRGWTHDGRIMTAQNGLPLVRYVRAV